MSRGKRYNGEQKLNIKKVIATILVFVVLVMIIMLIIKFAKKDKTKKADIKNVTNSYLSVYTNGKWGVINSKGEYVIEPTYDNMIIIPDSSKSVFICQKNTNLEEGTFDSIAIDNKSKTLFDNYEKVEAIQNIDKNGNVFYSDNVLKVSNNGKYGLINFNGKELLSCEFESINPIKYLKNSLVVSKDNKVGIVDNSGNMIIDNAYKDISGLTDKYEDGYIVKNDKNKYGLINYNKKQILDCKYDEIKNIYGNDMYVVKEGTTLEIVNSNGIVLTKNSFNEVVSINTNIIIKNSGKYGVISSNGSKIVDSKYQYLEYLYDGKYIAEKENKYGIINIDESEIVEFKYNKITYMSEEGFIEAEEQDGKTALMNTDFEIKTEGIVSEINSNYKFIKVRQDGEYKYYNYKLEQKTVQDIYPANTLFLSKKNGKYGFIDKNGIVIVDYIYDDATEQNDYGYAAIKKDGKWGALDSTGKVAVEPTYELVQNTMIKFIGKWHLAPDLNANYYTDTKE